MVVLAHIQCCRSKCHLSTCWRHLGQSGCDQTLCAGSALWPVKSCKANMHPVLTWPSRLAQAALQVKTRSAAPAMARCCKDQPIPVYVHTSLQWPGPLCCTACCMVAPGDVMQTAGSRLDKHARLQPLHPPQTPKHHFGPGKSTEHTCHVRCAVGLELHPTIDARGSKGRPPVPAKV